MRRRAGLRPRVGSVHGEVMAGALTLDSPLPRRLLAWSSERFPLLQAPLLLMFYGTALLYGRSVADTAPLAVRVADGLGFLAAWSFFLLLRIFDEHKDYVLDTLNHPQRVLQRGLITLGHLRVAGALAVGVQAAAAWTLDRGAGRVTLWWLCALGWSLLMAREFFAPRWLRSRVVLYAVSHMLVMPLALLWMAAMGAAPASLSSRVWPLAAIAFLSGAALEVTRKSWAPAEERDTIDSYCRIFGLAGAAGVIVVLLIASAVLQVLLLHDVFAGGLAWPWWTAALALLVAPLLSVLRFRSAPTVAGRKRNETAVGLYVLMANALLLCALAARRGVAC
jgi:hypothetical protein